MVLSVSLISATSMAALAMLGPASMPTFVLRLASKTISPEDLEQGRIRSIVLVDVRSPEEFEVDRIAGSHLIPIDRFQTADGANQVNTLVAASQSKGRQPMVVLYCQTGPRSYRAYKFLESSGVRMVVLEGGIRDWRKRVPADRDRAVLAPILLEAERL